MIIITEFNIASYFFFFFNVCWSCHIEYIINIIKMRNVIYYIYSLILFTGNVPENFFFDYWECLPFQGWTTIILQTTHLYALNFFIENWLVTDPKPNRRFSENIISTQKYKTHTPLLYHHVYIIIQYYIFNSEKLR